MFAYHAAALVAFAEHNESFAASLAHTLALHPLRHSATAPIVTSPYLLPATEDVARQRTIWLLEEFHRANPRQTVTAQAIFRHWLNQYQAPQDLVLGIVGLAIIGPTLGLVQKKKKRKSQMRIVVSDAVCAESLPEIMQIAHNASTSLLGNTLATVGGNSNRLDPEFAEWLFVDQETRLYTLPTHTLTELNNMLTHDNLPHFTLQMDNKIKAIAVAPCVRETLPLGTAL